MTGNGHTSYIPKEERLLERIYADEVNLDDTAMSIEELRHLIRLIDQSDVAELEVKQSGGHARLLLRKGQTSEQVQPQMQPAPVLSVEEATEEVTQVAITSTQVGSFQNWSGSKDTLFVKVGDMIQVGQHVGAIRSLNIPNEVESAVAGRVIEILVEDGQAIEYGQPLMIIEQV